MKVNKSVAVTDNIFLKSYFAKVIKTPELQFEVKKLLKGDKDSYTDIFDLNHSDFRAQDTSEKMRNSVITFNTTMRRGKTGDDDDKSLVTTGDAPKRAQYAFSNNTVNLLLSFFYTQSREWFYHMIKPEKDQPDEDKT